MGRLSNSRDKNLLECWNCLSVERYSTHHTVFMDCSQLAIQALTICTHVILVWKYCQFNSKKQKCIHKCAPLMSFAQLPVHIHLRHKFLCALESLSQPPCSQKTTEYFHYCPTSQSVCLFTHGVPPSLTFLNHSSWNWWLAHVAGDEASQELMLRDSRAVNHRQNQSDTSVWGYC